MNLVTLLWEEQLLHSHKALKWIDMLHMANRGHYGDSEEQKLCYKWFLFFFLTHHENIYYFSL